MPESQLNPSQKLARIGANSLPIYRVYRGFATAQRLRRDMRNPHRRDWGFAARTALDISTDKLDGYLASYAGKTRLGGYLDQVSDKFWYLTITAQLVRNKELNPIHWRVAFAQSVGSNVLRLAGEGNGVDSAAKDLGKWKFTLQAGAILGACSPLAAEAPELVDDLFNAASGLTVVSGLEQVQRFSSEIVSNLLHQDAA